MSQIIFPPNIFHAKYQYFGQEIWGTVVWGRVGGNDGGAGVHGEGKGDEHLSVIGETDTPPHPLSPNIVSEWEK